MSLDMDALDEFLDQHEAEPFLIFGFTFIIWKYLVQVLEETGKARDLSHGILIHGGGWKKLANQAVSKAEYKARCMITMEWRSRPEVFLWNVNAVICMLRIIPEFCFGERLIFPCVMLVNGGLYRCYLHCRKAIPDTVF